MAYDPILLGPLPDPRDSIREGGVKLNAMLDELYDRTNPGVIGRSAWDLGIHPDNTAAANKAALIAAIEGDTFAPVRDEYGMSREIIFPYHDDPYLIDGEIDVRRTIRLRGPGPHARTLGTPKLEITDGFQYGFWFKHVEVGSPVGGGWWSDMRDLLIEPATTGGVDYGVVNTCSVFFWNISVLRFKYVGFLCAGGTSGDDDILPGPHELDGQTTVRGSTNMTRYTICSARETSHGHGFAASGNNAAITLYDQCNSSLNNGCGFRDNTSIGCYYMNCHTAQNAYKTFHHAGTLGATTDAAGYAINDTVITLASSGVGEIKVNDLVSFDNGDPTRYLVTEGETSVADGGSITISTRIGAGGVEIGTGLKVAIPTSATAINVHRPFGPIKDTPAAVTGATTDAAGYAIGVQSIVLASAGTGAINVGDKVVFAGDATEYPITTGDTNVANGGTIVIASPGLVSAIPAAATAITVLRYSMEPGVGPLSSTYWDTISAQIKDADWSPSTQFWASGGVNVIDDSAVNHVNLGQYSEGGQEVGMVARGGGYAYGGNTFSPNGGRAYIGPEGDQFNHPLKPATWKNSDATHSWGGGIGTTYSSTYVYACGDTNDPDTNSATPAQGGLHLSFSNARKAWEWGKAATARVWAVTATGWSRGVYSGKGHLLAERGIIIGGQNGTSLTSPTSIAGRVMMYTNRAAIPTDTVLFSGDFLFYVGATSGQAVIEKVTVGGTIGGSAPTFVTIVSMP